MHPGTAVGFPAVTVHLANLLKHTRILLRPLTDRTVAPRVEPARADAIHTAQASHGMEVLLVLDEGEDLAFRAEVNAIAFFKRSCSSFSCS